MSARASFTFDHLGSEDEMGSLYGVLDRHGVTSTFFLEGEHGRKRPAAVADLVARGHELGMHGWAHEPWSELAPADEDDLAARATDALAEAAGVRPAGFRAPGGSRTAHTPAVLERLGYAYDASLGDGMRLGRLTPHLAQVPFVWPGVDGFHYLRDQPADPVDVQEQWLASLEKTAANGGLFLLICHAPITAVDDRRVAALEAVVAAAVADDRVQICTAGQLAEGVGAH
ncbi:MAG: polysaccharide deacetylase family protein [Actinobacteria bacterium]|nr:polysaccharide deacetylase family protein [Actinomycetota bacterium]